jgi:hypothetical protein
MLSILPIKYSGQTITIALQLLLIKERLKTQKKGAASFGSKKGGKRLSRKVATLCLQFSLYYMIHD